jgi:AcrR family transcriptional regulator
MNDLHVSESRSQGQLLLGRVCQTGGVSPPSEDSTRGSQATQVEPPAAPVGDAGSAAAQRTPAAATAREARRAQRLATRQREILSVAERLFAAHGYDGTSLEKIAAGAGYSVGAIYNFFPSKDAVYTAVLERNATAIAARLRQLTASPGSGLDKLLAMASTVIRQVHAYPDSAVLTLGSLAPERGPAAKESSTRPILEVYTAAIREGQLDATIRAGDPGLLAYYVGGLVFAHIGVSAHSAPGEPGIPVEEFLEILRRAMERPPA